MCVCDSEKLRIPCWNHKSWGGLVCVVCVYGTFMLDIIVVEHINGRLEAHDHTHAKVNSCLGVGEILCRNWCWIVGTVLSKYYSHIWFLPWWGLGKESVMVWFFSLKLLKTEHLPINSWLKSLWDNGTKGTAADFQRPGKNFDRFEWCGRKSVGPNNVGRESVWYLNTHP